MHDLTILAARATLVALVALVIYLNVSSWRQRRGLSAPQRRDADDDGQRLNAVL